MTTPKKTTAQPTAGRGRLNVDIDEDLRKAIDILLGEENLRRVRAGEPKTSLSELVNSLLRPALAPQLREIGAAAKSKKHAD